jgi:hypothetical protein
METFKNINMVELCEDELMSIQGGDYGDFIERIGLEVGRAMKKAFDVLSKPTKHLSISTVY